MAFTVATWNILATAYIRPSFYPRTPTGCLGSSWRIPELVRHVRALRADVLCLQEVEREVFAPLQSALDPAGYQGTYVRKSGNRPDGCAAFLRRDRFTLLDERRIALAFGHAAQLLHVEHEGAMLTVVNTHLKWDAPETLRDQQWGYRQITQILEVLCTETPAPTGEILCGDFNVLPRSDVAQALRDAGFDYAHRGHPEVRTCNSNGEAKLIDYLFYRGALQATPHIPVPIDDHTPLPSPEQPSDHLPLLAEFTWSQPIR